MWKGLFHSKDYLQKDVFLKVRIKSSVVENPFSSFLILFYHCWFFFYHFLSFFVTADSFLSFLILFITADYFVSLLIFLSLLIFYHCSFFITAITDLSLLILNWMNILFTSSNQVIELTSFQYSIFNNNYLQIILKAMNKLLYSENQKSGIGRRQ